MARQSARGRRRRRRAGRVGVDEIIVRPNGRTGTVRDGGEHGYRKKRVRTRQPGDKLPPRRRRTPRVSPARHLLEPHLGPVIPRIAEESEVFAPDYPGFGRSGGRLEPEEAAVPALASLVLRFADSLGIEKFAVAGHDIRALNDRGDESPEGELTDGILDQLAKFERAKTAERSRRGKLRKAREGKTMRTATPPYGFRYNEAGDALVVLEPEMAVVEKLFRTAADGLGTWKIQARLHAAGVPAPMGGPVWDINVIKRLVLNDLYKPHTYQEMAELLGPEALARLEPGGLYGVQWHNRRKTETRTVSEPDGNGGRIYRQRRTTKERPREDWIAVPVPAPIPPAVAEAARRVVDESRPRERKYLTREWELRGLLRCPCGASMRTQTTNPHNKGHYFYYSCSRRRKLRKMCDCRQPSIRAGDVEPVVWEFVRGLLLDPERIRAGMERMIAAERETSKGSPEREARMWSDRLADAGRKRSRYQEMAAEGLITFGELRERLAELGDACEVVRGELDALAGRVERAEQLERDMEALLEQTAGVGAEDLDALAGGQRNEIYRMLRLEITPSGEGYAMRGVFRTDGLLSTARPGASSRSRSRRTAARR